VVELSTHPKIVGWSPASTAYTGREKRGKSYNKKNFTVVLYRARLLG
jgi:hypothetical protein